MRTVYHNARVYTGQLPLQQAFSVEDGRFCFVGSNEDAMKLEGEKVDFQGAFVCAGFNDSHMHILNYGQALTMAPLAAHTGSLEELIACLKDSRPGRGGWILGRGWNQDFFAGEKRMPTRWDLDQVSRVYPVCAVRACGHALAVNSRALELLGITGDTPQPEGGEIVLEQGQPNGIFFDNAMDLILLRLPSPGKEELREMIRVACQELNRHGITSCQSDDYCVFQNLPWQTVNQVFQEMEATGELTVRVYEQANFTNLAALEGFVRSGNHTGTGTPMFRMGPLKMLGDGALGARTAFLSIPYEDDPTTRGLSVFPAQTFDTLIGYAHRHGIQCAIHCIGDACLDLVLSAIEKALAQWPRKNHRHGIVHCQITRPDQLRKMADLGLHIYAQSIFLDYDIHMVYQRVGQTLASTSYSWKWLLDHGCSISNGSDCPVEQPNVLGGIQCGVTRQDLQGFGPYLPDQAFTVQEALDSFTSAGAWASFEEDLKGQIQPGMLADFVVLEEDPFGAEPERIKDIRIIATYLEGCQVYRR